MSVRTLGVPYVDLLNALIAVQNVAQIPIQHRDEIETLTEIASDPHKARFLALPKSVEETAQKASRYAINHLFIWAAAKRVGQLPLAEFCIAQWTRGLNNEVLAVTYNCAHLLEQEFECCEKTDSALLEIGVRVQRPYISTDKDWESLLSQLSFLAQDVLLDAAKIPKKYASNLEEECVRALSFSHLRPEHKTLIRRYKDAISDIQLKDVGDHRVIVVLRVFSKLTRLDLTNCIGLTSASLEGGHPQLETLVLDGTSLGSESIDRKLFPRLQHIENRQQLITCDIGKAHPKLPQ